MSVKMTGAEYKRFVAAPWDEDCDLYMDDVSYELNGKPLDEADCDLEEILSDADRLIILSGRLCRNSDPRFSHDFVTFARKWLKAQTKSCVVFEMAHRAKAGEGLQIAAKIAQRVAELRAHRKLSLQDLAVRSGLTKSHIWELENGRSANPTVTTAVALSAALGVSLDYLMGLSSEMPNLHPDALRIAWEVDALLRAAALPDRCAP